MEILGQAHMTVVLEAMQKRNEMDKRSLQSMLERNEKDRRYLVKVIGYFDQYFRVTQWEQRQENSRNAIT